MRRVDRDSWMASVGGYSEEGSVYGFTRVNVCTMVSVVGMNLEVTE